MLAFNLLFLSLFLPLLAISWLWRRSPQPRLSWLATFVFAAVLVIFTFFATPWSFIGYPLRFITPVLLVIATFVSLRRREETRAAGGFLIAVQLLLTMLFGAAATGAIRGQFAPAETLDLAFPLRDGAYVAGHAGSSTVVNYHYVHPSQRYALDILKLNPAGLRARGVYPQEPARYAIWGTPILSPCAGRVAAAVDGIVDNVPPAVNDKQIAGNYVALECGSAVVYLAHMQRGSVKVRSGDAVTAGAVLGRVGNSGNTTEPHLHVHAERGPWDGKFSGRPAVAITFDGRFLARNSIYIP